MRDVLIIILFFSVINIANGQDCLHEIKDYYSSIDTTERPVFRIAAEMPEIMKPEVFMEILGYQVFDSLKCCPIRVWCCFVVEPDSSLTNIKVCTKMMFCDNKIINSETEKFNDKVIQQLNNRKSKPGKHNGKNVAVACVMPIRYECFDWE